MSIAHNCTIELPAWVAGWIAARDVDLPDHERAMRLAIELAAESVRQGTGGPFGALIFNPVDGGLVSLGVNLVTSSGLSVAHAEVVAISLAQRRLGRWNLDGDENFTLVTTCEPCSMCFGALPWSGVRSLVCGARKADAEAAGFDEGDKPADWVGSLAARGISVQLEVLRDEAAEIFTLYRERGGVIYNPKTGSRG